MPAHQGAVQGGIYIEEVLAACADAPCCIRARSAAKGRPKREVWNPMSGAYARCPAGPSLCRPPATDTKGQRPTASRLQAPKASVAQRCMRQAQAAALHTRRIPAKPGEADAALCVVERISMSTPCNQTSTTGWRCFAALISSCRVSARRSCRALAVLDLTRRQAFRPLLIDRPLVPTQSLVTPAPLRMRHVH